MKDGKIIIDKILEKSQSDVAAIQNAAAKEVEKIMDVADEKVMKEKMDISKMADAEAEKIKAKEISAAELQARLLLLETKQTLIADVIAEAESRLESMADAEYCTVIGTMLDAIVKEDGAEIIVSKKDKTRLADVIAQKGYILSNEEREMGNGFIVKNGEVEYNYTFQSILTVEQEEIRQIAAKHLF
ncbi:V-type ATP synthase subunit E [Chakrabartyella piscis]|uniref:V-type ATP synthase subunit E n=1 Tax=Chakrabartyella piscis TaxID=2918914 RepID=UPI002958CE7F|nr:V-type ATP synthase subunit E [Chakrabartyella piscis]